MKAAKTRIQLLSVCFCLLFSAAAFAVDTDGDGVDDSVDAFPNNPLYSVDTDHDTLPDDWEIAHGRNPNVADYVLSSNCAVDDQGIKYWNGGSGACAPRLSIAGENVYRTVQSFTQCPNPNAPHMLLEYFNWGQTTCDSSFSKVSCTSKQWTAAPASCSSMHTTYIYTSMLADGLAQISTFGGTSVYKDVCFLDFKGIHCFTGSTFGV